MKRKNSNSQSEKSINFEAKLINYKCKKTPNFLNIKFDSITIESHFKISCVNFQISIYLEPLFNTINIKPGAKLFV